MEAAIAWLVQTILATLLIDKLDAWIRRVGLADDIEKLKSEIRRIKIVVSAVKERGIGNDLLAEPLALLEDQLYEADDLIDELDYYRLQQEVQGVTIEESEGMHGTERVDEILRGDTVTPNSSVGKLRSMVWEHFTITQRNNGKPFKAECKYCGEEFSCDTKMNGTSSMKKHLENEHSVTCTKEAPGAHAPNTSSAGEPIVTGNSSRGKEKKRRSKAWGLVDVIEDENGNLIKAKCKYCHTEIKCGGSNGTGSILNHYRICKKKPGSNDQPPNPSSTGDASANVNPIVISDPSNRKRRRTDEESAQITADNTYTPWDKTKLSNMIQKITSQLQDSRGQVSEVLTLHGSDFASRRNYHQSTTSDQQLRTSSVFSGQVYGRISEKNSIIKLIVENKSGNVIVLPIVGIGGVGKTTLVQDVYNDSEVKSKFDHRIWIWVSRNFDEMGFTKEILDFVPQERHEVPQERHEGINSFAKLQEMLTSRAKSKRLLLVLDDVWDDMNDRRWIQLLAPIKSNTANGNVIIVTSRKLSVAQLIRTTGPIKLGALEHDYFWLLFKLHAFGDEHYIENQDLMNIGQKIAEKLKGNPLAAESTGKLLKDKLNIDHWNHILKKEGWKSLKLSGGIMHALKSSYDQLPYNLQQCFVHCSIFPDGYQFHGGELACLWISQGFVKGIHSSKIMEELEQNYLTPLVNLGFFQQFESEESSRGSQTCYAVCGLMHDFSRIVSLSQCATIDGMQRNKMSPTIRHLSIVTSSEYRKDEHGNIPRNKKFEMNLRDTVTSVSKLRTLVLLGHYDSFFLQSFQELFLFQNAHNLRLLQMSARSADFLKCGSDEVDGALPQVLSKLYHLQVLNVGSYTDPTIPDGINNLVSLRHLVVHKGVYSSVGSMTSFQEPRGFKFRISSGFEMTQLQSTDESVQHWMHVKTMEEAYEAGLRNNELSEKLLLSWKRTSSAIGMELEPHSNVMDLNISGYEGDDSIISTSFQAVHIHDCIEWKILPSFGRFPFLTKLKLSNLEELKEVLVPSLEELVLVGMPKLERCSCTSVEGMNSRLRALQIEYCEALKEFDLFENDNECEIEHRSWLPGLEKLILCHCPHLKVLKPLPPSTTCSELLITRVSILPSIKGSCSEMLHIGLFDDDDESGDEGDYFDEYSQELRLLDNKILAFHNLCSVKLMRIVGCENLSSFSIKGFSQLVSLKSLHIWRCKKISSSDVMPDATHENVSASNCMAFACLESLSIKSCEITEKWLSLLLRHAPELEELCLEEILLMEEEGDSTELAQIGLVHIPLNLISSLKNITVTCCPPLAFTWSEEGFSGFTSLRELVISCSPGLLSSLMLEEDGNDDQANRRLLLPGSHGISGCSQETLQTCFPRHLTSLKKLVVVGDPRLESLQLLSCTSLEELAIRCCESLTALEGLQSLGSLKHLAVHDCPSLRPCLESFFSRQGYELCSRLETLEIDDPSVLTTSLRVGLTSLRRLKLAWLVLTEEQESALVLLTSLQELEFNICSNLVHLPAGLHLLPSLKRLKIRSCPGISRLLETDLPLSLEELKIEYCTKNLADKCRLLATSKLNVEISNCTY